MMEGEGDDDQSSGWHQVKKKHRTSSKLSIQKVSWGSFNKREPFISVSQASKDQEVGSLHGRCQVLPAKEGRGCSTNSNVPSDGYVFSASTSDRGVESFDKVVTNQESGSPKVVQSMSLKVAESEGQPKAIQEVFIQENVEIVPKIKWGDLEEVDLSLTGDCGDSSKFPKAESLYSGEHANVADSGEAIFSTSCIPLQVGEITLEDVELLPVPISSDVRNEPRDETWKEVSEIPSEDLDVVELNFNYVAETLNQTHNHRINRTTESETDGDVCAHDTIIKGFPSSPLEKGEAMTLQEPYDIPVDEAMNISEQPVVNDDKCIIDGSGDTIFSSNLNTAVEVSVYNSVTETLESRKGTHYDFTEGLDDSGEGEPGESKERFRERLWCFLFENLNRAFDELYLLCELECDVEQMDEAILVLEEAASDFKELKCRVDHFENTKCITSQSSKDGAPINVKTDHRRPHALSWEVRRMTTSPHRAEILSSSLEAFKKIQLGRAGKHVSQDAEVLRNSLSTTQHDTRSSPRVPSKSTERNIISYKQRGTSSTGQGSTKLEKLNGDASRHSRAGLGQNGRLPPQSQMTPVGKLRKESLEPISEAEKQLTRKDGASSEYKPEKQVKIIDTVKRNISLADKEKEKEKEKHNVAPWKPMDAWKEKRNWEDILKSPLRSSTRVTHSPNLARKGTERARVLHDKLMSPEKKKKTAIDLKREAEEKHARALRIRSQLDKERAQRLQRTSDKVNRVNEWQADRSLKLREGMHARHQRSESRHEAYLAQVAKRAGDESSKVNEVRFITSLNEENKKLILRQKLHDSEMRRAEKLQVIKIKQKEDLAREEAVIERRKLREAQKLQRLAETQRKKEEAQVRREEERKASSAAREAKALEQLRKKEVRARAQQEEAELLAQRLAERLSESEQRRKSYLEQIREKASMDFRDQSSPLLRRSLVKEGQSRSISANSVEEYQNLSMLSTGESTIGLVNVTQQQSLKRRIKRIRQRLMSFKYEFIEPPVGNESSWIGYRALVGTARAKIGRWLQELQRLRQARKEGAASIGLIVAEMVKFLEGKDPELHAARQAGLLDFISSALPASHTTKPDACKVIVYLLRLLRVVLSVPGNRSYFLAQNLLPPIIPMLSASLENYIKIAASSSAENLEGISEVLDGFLWTVTIIVGHAHTDERQLQMQDGLLELIVAYQIIHRLRDLFALYDRPQVEGSPFPTSILLSLNFLAVLTCTPRTISSIDWEACISKTVLENKVQVPENLDSQDIGADSRINIPPANVITDLSATESDKGEKLYFEISSKPDNPISRAINGEFKIESSITIDGQGNVGIVESAATVAAEKKIVSEVHTKSVSPQKNGKNSTDNHPERRKMTEPIIHDKSDSKKVTRLKLPVSSLLSVIAETGLVGLPSLLTAVLLQANNRLSSEQASYILPSNFEEVATGVLKVLNNLALLDITLLQRMLARPDLKMELFHLMSFLLSYCSSKWKSANDQVGLLLLESLLLLGYFALFHPGNQAVLRWGKSPTILHKVCDLPFVFFSDPELTPILASTLVAACFGCDQNRGLVLQELSVDMLLTLLKTCRQGLLASQSDVLPLENAPAAEPYDGSQSAQEARKSQLELPLKPNRKGSRVASVKVSISNSNIKTSRAKLQRDSRRSKTCDDWALKHNLPSSEASHSFMLHQRFPTTLLDKAEEFFTSASLDPQI